MTIPWNAAYIWGGILTINPGIQGFFDTVGQCVNYGFKTLRFAITPSASPGYGIPIPSGGNRNLSYILSQMLDNPVWDDTRIERIMLTAQDFTLFDAAGGSNNGYMTPSILTAGHTACVAEYTAMFNVLKSRFGSRPIQFVLSNWEGDNMTTGGVYSYVTVPGFAAAQQATWGGATLAQRGDRMLIWWSYKDEAVAAFKAANAGFDLIHAPEFSCGTLFDFATTATVDDALYRRIGLAGGREYASYSSYDAQPLNLAAMGRYYDYIQMLNRIYVDGGVQKLIIGETGYDLNNAGAATIPTLWEMHSRKTIPYADRTGRVIGIVPWNSVLEVGHPENYGMLKPNGAMQLLKDYKKVRPFPPRVGV